MDFRTLAALGAALSAPFGIGFLLAPSASAALYGAAQIDAFTVLLCRYFGSAMLMYAAAVWGLRGLRDPADQRRAAATISAAVAAGLVVTLQGVGSGTLNALGWSSVALYGFFAAAWGRLALSARVGLERRA